MRCLLVLYVALSCLFLNISSSFPPQDAVLVTRDEVTENESELGDLVDKLWEDVADFLNEVAPKCGAGTYYNSTTKKCEDCPAGQYSQADQTSCTPCPEGYYNPKPGQGFCLPCSEGTYASGTSNVNCTTCRAGYISDETAAAHCTACLPGEHSDADHSECMECGAGTYSDVPSDVCTPCPSDTVSDTGASECTVCSPNTHPDSRKEQCVTDTCVPGEKREDDGTCVACPPGSFSSVFNATTCTNCFAGTYNPMSNQTSCTLCALGTFTNSTGSVECLACSAGQYANKSGSVSCTACVPGTSTNNKTGSVECAPCVLGTFSNVSGSVICSKCQPGSSTDGGTGATSCSLCRAGDFAPTEGSPQCSKCGAGTSTVNKTGADACTKCRPGYFAGEEGSVLCDACIPGSYADQPGSSSCTSCTAGSYAAGSGTINCTDCEAGSYQDKEGQTECDLCATGSYQNETGGVSCTDCRDKQTYTTYSTGSKSAEDCQGPLLRYVINNNPNELTDTGSITVGEVDTLELVAVSGDWALRNPEQPYSEFDVLKQGDKSITAGVLIKILVEPMMTNVFCYKDTEGHGQYFAGYQRKDRQGRKCYTPCRNTAGVVDTGPYCQVDEGASSCGIPKCVWDVACSAGDGTGYRGLVTYVKIEGGELVPCQAWNKDYPHVHPEFHPTSHNVATYGLGHHNYCRNPDPGHTHSPWCYTIDFWVRWKYCSVSKCDASFPYFE